jgi:hypothetical protein
MEACVVISQQKQALYHNLCNGKVRNCHTATSKRRQYDTTALSSPEYLQGTALLIGYYSSKVVDG